LKISFSAVPCALGSRRGYSTTPASASAEPTQADQRQDDTTTGEAQSPAHPPPHPQSTQRRMAFFSAFFLVFVFARRRRMASRFHPTPCEM